MRHLFCVENIDRWCSNWPLGAKMCFFDPKFEYLGPKVNYLFWNRDFCQQGISPVCPGLQLFHLDHPPKNFCFWARGHFRGSPLCLALLGHFHFRGISTLNFGPFSTKLGGTVQAVMKMTQNDNGPGLGRNYGDHCSPVGLASCKSIPQGPQSLL